MTPAALPPEIIVVARKATVAHPSYVAGGYIVLTSGASAFRNADLVPCNPHALLAWCRSNGCAVVLIHDEPSTKRYRVRFADAAAFASFLQEFR
jgi:hypothetical protein